MFLYLAISKDYGKNKLQLSDVMNLSRYIYAPQICKALSKIVKCIRYFNRMVKTSSVE